MGYRPDTLYGIIEFCDAEGQPCDSLVIVTEWLERYNRGQQFREPVDIIGRRPAKPSGPAVDHDNPFNDRFFR